MWIIHSSLNKKKLQCFEEIILYFSFQKKTDYN